MACSALLLGGPKQLAVSQTLVHQGLSAACLGEQWLSTKLLLAFLLHFQPILLPSPFARPISIGKPFGRTLVQGLCFEAFLQGLQQEAEQNSLQVFFTCAWHPSTPSCCFAFPASPSSPSCQGCHPRIFPSLFQLPFFDILQQLHHSGDPQAGFFLVH